MIRKQLCVAIAAILGIGAGANGCVMLVSPVRWYFAVPGVTNTGPFNQHFIRDIGIIYLFLGAAFLVGAARAEFRVVLWGAASLWLCCHALFHVWEVAVGICGSSALVQDFPLVTLPGLIGLALTLWAIGDRRIAQPPHPISKV